jgi:hypothetical protein
MSNIYDLSFIKDIEMRKYVDEALCIIIQLELIDFIKTYNPPSDTGFMFSNNENIINIMKKISETNKSHSGFSLSYTMRYIQYIFKNF